MEGAGEGPRICRIVQYSHSQRSRNPLMRESFRMGESYQATAPGDQRARADWDAGWHARESAPPTPKSYCPVPSRLKAEDSERVPLDPHPVLAGCNCNQIIPSYAKTTPLTISNL